MNELTLRRAEESDLVVADDHVNARSLYESVGFALRYTGVHTRKDW